MIGRKKLILVFIAVLTFLLFAFSAFIPTFAKGKNKEPPLRGYQNVVSAKDGRSKKISGCVSQDELSKLFEDKLDGIADEIEIKTSDDILNIKGRLLADSEKLFERFPKFRDAAPFAELIAGAEVNVKLQIIYDCDKGFNTEVKEVKIAKLGLPTDIFSAFAEEIECLLNEKLVKNTEIHSWRLEKGGLYYSVTVEDENDIGFYYPIGQ